MKTFILGLVIAIAFSVSAWAEIILLETDASRQALERFDAMANRALEGEGLSTQMNKEDCEEVIKHARDRYMKRLRDWEIETHNGSRARSYDKEPPESSSGSCRARK